MKSCVEPYYEGKNAWKNSKIAILLKIKGIAGSIILGLLLLTSKPLWWPSEQWLTKNLTSGMILFWLMVAFIISAIGGIIYLRRRTIRSLNIKFLLHQLSHTIRDAHSNWFKRYDAHKEDISASDYKNHFIELLELTKDYFVEITNDKTIEAAIRIAIPDEQYGNVLYSTLARTKGLNAGRDNTSEDIPANEGLPRYLIEKHKKCQVLLYNDIKEAIEHDLFKKTRSEDIYPNEIVTMMVAPLNAWDGKLPKRMIGILYITSRNKNTFKEKHVDSVRFVADKIADSLSITTELGKLIHKNKGGN